MKKIHLIRHAKSSWNHPSLADIDRPLNARGLRTAPHMAAHIQAAGCKFEEVFASPAQRAQSTIEAIADALPALSIRWQTISALYTFSSSALLHWIQSLDASITEPVLIGHNPAFTELCNLLGDTAVYNLPTCGYAQLCAQTDCSWQEIDKTPMQLSELLKPKQLL